MATNLPESILAVIQDFWRCTGVSPRTLYLGKDQIKEVWAKHSDIIFLHPFTLDDTIMYLRLIRVEKDDWIEVGL